MDNRYNLLLWQIILMFLCPAEVRTMSALSPLDPSSYSRPELAIINHMTLKLNINFEKEVIHGQAILHFKLLADISELPLDINGLKIESINIDEGSKLDYNLSDHVPNYGSKLTILLPKQIERGERLKIAIAYSTDPSALGLTWIKASLTSGKKHPYLYSQSSPIHARSILPCQDTPAVKFTYDAEITAPEGLTVLMSALKGEVIDNKSCFNQPVPMPSSLFAIAVGDLDSRPVGARSKVWAEKQDVDRYAYEFAETGIYLEAAEKICGPYEWTQYDLLVLPPSFPHGAMENPCITFVSPTVVVGDRSLTSVIIHEIMHSWTGNLVSIKNYEHFWLKEGFTVFLERKVASNLINDTAEAKRNRDFHSILGLQELKGGVNLLGATNPLTSLALDLDGVHPDDSFSIIPYEKGSLFLRYLEDLFGGAEVFDDYIRSYVTEFRKQSINTQQFKAHFLKYFEGNDKLETVDWNAWFYGTGMPPVIPQYDATMTEEVISLIAEMEKSNFTYSHDDIQDFNMHQVIYLLELLIERSPLSLEDLTNMGKEYAVDNSKADEIVYRWLRLNLKSRNSKKLADVFTFVNSLGRLKYVRPLYRDLYAWEDVRQQAIDNFLENEPNMSHLTAYNLKHDLHLVE